MRKSLQLHVLRAFALLFASLLTVTGLQAQNLTVTGKITDQSGVPVIGATVTIQGTQQGTFSNASGDWSLQVPGPDAVLEFFQLGYARVTQPLNSRSVINVSFTETAIDLEEVVVIGYGAATKKDLTGSVSVINAESLAKEQPQTVADLLRNNVPGLTVGMNNTAEGNSTDFVVRGKTNLRSEEQMGNSRDNAYNAPLIVLDDVIYYGRLTDINPNDIQSLTVLKDSSSAAIYGAKASNGVIMITTKKGKQGKPMISLSATVGMQMLGRSAPMYSGEDFVDYRAAAMAALGVDPARLVDPRTLSGGDLTTWMGNQSGEPLDIWLERLNFSPSMIANYKAGKTTPMKSMLWNEIAMRQDYTLSVSGRNGDTSYYTSVGFTDNESNIKGSGFRSIKARINLESKISKHVTYGVNAQYTNQERGYVSIAATDARLSPYATYYNEDGSLVINPDGGNSYIQSPLIGPRYTDRMDNTSILSATGFLKVSLPYGFSLETRFSPYLSYNQYYNHSSSESPLITDANRATAVTTTRNNNNYYNWQWDNLLKWNKSYGKHTIDFTGLLNWEQRNSWLNGIYGRDFAPSDALGWHGMQWAQSITLNGSNGNYDRIRTSDAVMARLQYNYDRRYQVTASWRRDGDAEFGKLNPRADFFAGAVAWTFTEESFWPENDWLTWGKLRLSYGENGNRQVGTNAALMTTTSSKYTYVLPNGTSSIANAYYASKMANYGLRWEKTSSWNAALDFSLFNDKVSGTIDVYKKVTNGLVKNRELPTVTGFTGVVANIGEIQNSGIEIALNSRNYSTRNFKWDSQFSYVHNKNRINSLGMGKDANGKELDDVGNKWFIGKSMNAIWDYEVLGTWKSGQAEEAAKFGQKPGDFKLNKNDWSDTAYGDKDKKFLGSTEPLHRLQLRNTFVFWENLTLSINMYSYLGFKKSFDMAKQADNLDKISPAKYPYWTESNQRNDFASLGSKSPGGVGFSVWRSGNFLKVDNISVGYQVPSKYLDHVKVHALNVNVSLKNGILLSRWPGEDPELGANASSGDFSKYSPIYLYFGVNATF